MRPAKPGKHLAGYVTSLRSGPLLPPRKRTWSPRPWRGWVVVYDASKNDLDEEDGRWVAVCETHGTVVSHSSLKDARSTMKSGSTEFCDECREMEL